MPHPVDAREELISLVTAALRAAEVDAKTGKLIFRDEWRPTPRLRSSTSRTPPSTGAHQDPSWWSSILAQCGVQLQQDQPLASTSTSTSGGARPDVGGCADADGGAGWEDVQEEALQPRTQQDVEGAVAELLRRNRDVFDKIINHSFPRKLGDGTASLDGFRYYMIQDMKYLETCAQLKMIAAGMADDFEEVRAFDARHKKSLQYVDNLKTICITKLGIPARIIEATPRSDELKTSERFYKLALQDRREDAFFGYYVVLLPCVLSYWKIAHRLMHASSTVKNVVYHTTWTEENDDDSSVVKYTKFINENIAAKGGVDQWNYIFNIACMLEAQLFDTGLQHHTLFQIIPDGAYFIYNSSREGVMLAIPKVEGALQSPFDGSSVVVVDKIGGDNEKWLVDATKNGYTFQNLGTRLYLGVSFEEGRILQAVSEPYYWWINPVPSQSNQGSPLYQIHDSVNLRYTLCADTKVLNSLGSARLPISLHDSESKRSPSVVSCQMWSFDRLEQLATHTPDLIMSSVDDKWYEQQLAERDRRLQDMESRQQAIAQEEQKEREALNLEVQRLKSELHWTRAQLSRHLQENMLYKDEIRRAETQNEETKRRLEEKANELKGAQAFLKHANMLSGADVISLVDRLNSEVFQGAASMVDTFEFEGASRRMDDAAWKRAMGATSKTVGGELTRALIAQRGMDKDDYDPILVQYALQTCLIFCCFKICISWAPEEENSQFLRSVYSEIQKKEDQVVAGRWRALTRAHIRETRNPDAETKQIIRELCAVLIVAGCSDKELSTEFEKDLSEITTLAIRVQIAIGESITSMDLEPYILPPGIPFNAALMEEEGGSQAQGTKTVGCTGLGLTQLVDGDRTILVRAKVLLDSAL